MAITTDSIDKKLRDELEPSYLVSLKYLFWTRE